MNERFFVSLSSRAEEREIFFFSFIRGHAPPKKWFDLF